MKRLDAVISVELCKRHAHAAQNHLRRFVVDRQAAWTLIGERKRPQKDAVTITAQQAFGDAPLAEEAADYLRVRRKLAKEMNCLFG